MAKPEYNVDLGGMTVNLFEGLSPAEREAILGSDEPEKDKEEEPTGGPNAAIEGEQTQEEPEEAKPEPEPPKQEVAPEPEPPPKVEEAKLETDALLKLKIKVQGEEKEVSLTREELIKRIQLAEDYQRKTARLAEERRKIEPYLHVTQTDAFQTWLAEQQEQGVFEKPKPEVIDPGLTYQLERRKSEPDYDEVMQAMREHAAMLTTSAQYVLDTHPPTFIAEYDRIASDLRSKRAIPSLEPVKPTPPDPEVTRKILASKEKAKDVGAVLKPGGSPEEMAEMRHKKAEKALIKRMREGDTTAAAELIMLRGIFQ